MRNALFLSVRRRTLVGGKLLLSLMLSLAAASVALAQGELGSGTILGSGSGTYTYALTFGDQAGATSPIGSVWYAWVPGQFYLPGTPTSASAPAGWTATISGASIQFVASSPANYIAPGQFLSGFSYHATFSPTQLNAAPNSGVSVAYSAGLFSDGGNTFTVQYVPEPSAAALLLCVGAGLSCRLRRGQRA